MFISKVELEKINSQIAFLQALASKFQSEINALKVQQEKSSTPAKAAGKNKKPRSAESKAKQSEIMKAYWAAKKAKKAAE